MRIAINSLWESFQSPKKTEKKILKETFTASNQGTVREEEEFQLPIVHPWNGGTLTTLVDIMTFKSKKYDHQDEGLISIPIDKYILYRDGLDSVSDEVIEERGDDIPYDLTKFDVRVIPGSFNVQKKQVGLDIVKLYKRADQSSYKRKLKVDKHPAEAVSSKISYEHNDQELYSQEIVPYRTVYEGKTLDLEPQRQKRVEYTLAAADATVIPSSFNVKKKQVGLNVVRSYKRADRSTYKRELRVEDNPAVAGNIFYEHHDRELYSQEMVPYYTVYEGKTLELEPQREGKVEYTPMIVDATVIPGSFNVQEKHVGLNVVRSYKRADQSLYRRELRVDQNPAEPLSLEIFYEHNDQELYSQEMLPYHTIYEGKALNLYPQKKGESLPYRVKNTASDVDRSALRVQDGAVLNRTIAMIKTIEYERADLSIYAAREKKTVNVEQTERIDEARRKKYIDYIVQYERIRTVLSTKEEYYVPIPSSIRGSKNEDIFRLFCSGKLVYKPDPSSDMGKIELPIASLANPLEGTFDLSGCGDAGRYLSIHTGYKKGEIEANRNKLEIWFVPRFIVAQNRPDHLRYILYSTTWEKWSEKYPIGIFWTWGNWNDLRLFSYLTNESPEKLSDNNLYAKWSEGIQEGYNGLPSLSRRTFYHSYSGVGSCSHVDSCLKFYAHFV